MKLKWLQVVGDVLVLAAIIGIPLAAIIAFVLVIIEALA